MKTIAIANQKGGTGKTTTAYNLGIALTQQGYRVLMVDFDPQGNLSCYCGIPPEQDLEQTITELLMKVAYEKPLSHRECVYQSKRTDDSAPQVDFIPSNLRLASFELAMGTMMCREVLLKTCLEQYSSQYDYCIIDCSPSVGLLLTNALSAANEVIILDAGAAVLGGWYVAADKFDFQRATQNQPRTTYQGRFADDDPAYKGLGTLCS